MDVAVAHLAIDKDLCALVADVGIVHEDATTSHLVFLDGIGNGHLILGDEPHVAIHAAVIGEVERHLLLARRVVLVVAVVGFDGDDDFRGNGQTVANKRSVISRERDGYGQIAAFVVFHLLAIDVDGLFAHDGLEVQGDLATSTLLGQAEVFTIPHHALIVAAATGLGRHELYGMRCRDHLPRLVVEILGFCSCHIAAMEAPASVEVPHQASAILQGEESCDGGSRLRHGLSVRDKGKKE